MFLKTLSLRGFKSFADPTTLEFEPGVTVVVGPNGSGKSNVVDAVAWVLGAQGPRTLRSAKMDDVIFAGTARRPALGRAEVSLTIDNSAHRLPIDFAEVTVTRTLFRTGDSEYALNGTPCRLLDIQELFSDTGVGRQQHVIISQGQLDAILSARPEDRRAVIEEAAGVLKYRRRRERAERRLETTEASLVRLQDLLREVRRQLKPLERQAEAARRHGQLATELRSLRFHVAGRGLVELDRRAEAAGAAAARLAAEESEERARVAALDEVIAAGEAAVAAAQQGDLAALLARADAVGERARGTARLLVERRKSVAAALEAAADGDVVAARESEAAATARELEEAGRRAVALSPEWDALSEQERRLAAELAQLEERFAGRGQPAAPSGAAGVRSELARAREQLARHREELARVTERVATLERRQSELAEAATVADGAVAGVAEALAQAVAAEGPAVSAAAGSAAEAARAGEVARRAEGAHLSAVARADALAAALDEAAARAGVAQLAGMAGVFGTVLDAVRIEPGFELAFEAAAEAALEAVLVEDVATGRAALAELRRTRGGGAVLVAGLAGRAVAPDPAAAALGAGLVPLAQRVTATLPAMQATLDALVWGVVCCSDSVEQACDVALATHGVTVVTPEGDRFGPAGWRAGAGRAGATRAALEEALVTAEAARLAAAAASAEAAEAAATSAAAARRAAEATRQREHLEADQRRQSASAPQAAAQAAKVEADLSAARQHAGPLADRAQDADALVASLAARLDELERQEAESHARLAEERAARAAVEARARAIASLRADLEIRAAALEERRALLGARADEVQRWLERHESGRQAAAARRLALEASEVALSRLGRSVEAAAARLAAARERLGAEHQRRLTSHRDLAQRLGQARRDRSMAEQQLATLRDRLQRAEIEGTEVRMRREAAEEAVRNELDAEPDEVRGAPCPELPPSVTAGQRVRELDRELRGLGPVNALAEEELRALEERAGFLGGQLEDVRSARRELGGVVRAVDGEIAAMFDAAYDDVARHFEVLFTRLFPGGTGRLVLVPGETPLDGGVEIEARPAGRNVRRLSLLSGGERSLVALAFLFAVFRSRPSPFYLMDEVEAALDDVNLHRFLDLVDEFRDEAQLILVSHQKRTMEAADVLYGVTMQPGGASKVVSERVGPAS